MCDYPPAIQGLFLAFAALGLLCLITTAIFLWGARSGEMARRSPKLIRYDQPEAQVIRIGRSPGRVQGKRLGEIGHGDLFRDQPAETLLFPSQE